MVAVPWALLLLTFAVTARAIEPAPSPTVGLDIAGPKFLNFGGPMQCRNVLKGVEAYAGQFLELLVRMNIKFLPNRCKELIGLPLNCFERIFPFHIFSISFGDKVNRFCHNFRGGKAFSWFLDLWLQNFIEGLLGCFVLWHRFCLSNGAGSGTIAE